MADEVIEASVWGVNERGEIVAATGSGTPNVVGYISEAQIPQNAQGRVVLANVPTFVYDGPGNVLGIQGTGGVLFPLITNSTFATLPAAASNAGRIMRVTDLNNALFESNGTRWKPVNGCAVIGSIDAPITTTGTVETNLFRKTLPAGLLQNGDRLRLRLTAGKSGTVETAAMTVRLGKSANTGDAIINTATVLSAANQSYGLLYDLRRANATSVLKLGQGTTSTSYAGGSTPPVPAAVSVVDSMDTNAFYYSVNWAMSAASEIFTLHDLTLELVSAAG